MGCVCVCTGCVNYLTKLLHHSLTPTRDPTRGKMYLIKGSDDGVVLWDVCTGLNCLR